MGILFSVDYNIKKRKGKGVGRSWKKKVKRRGGRMKRFPEGEARVGG